MKKNDKDQMLKSGVKELSKKASELRKQIAEDTLKRRTTQVKNVHAVKILRQKLAIVLTLMRAKEIQGL